MTSGGGGGAAAAAGWPAAAAVAAYTQWMGEQPGRLHCQPQAAGSTAWPTAYLGTGTAVLELPVVNTT